MSEKTVVLENLSELYWAEFPGPTNVVIKNDENWFRRIGTIIKDNILSLKIEKPGVFRTSEDGKLLYAKDPESRNLWIIDYFGKDDKEIVIEDGVYGIYRGAFQGAKSIKSVMFPKSVQVIGERSFEGCKSLEKIKFSEGLKRIGDYAFQHTGIKKVDIPASVSTIGGKSFGDCFRLESVYFKENCGITVLNGTFSGCKKLSKVVLPDHLRHIRSFCFDSCNSLDELHLPRTVKRVDACAMYPITELYIENGNAPEGVVASIANPGKINREVTKSFSFTIHFRGSRIIFPREMNRKLVETAEHIVQDAKKNTDIVCSSFAKDSVLEVQSALEAVRKYHIDSTKRFLKYYNSYEEVLSTLVTDEGLMNDLLKMYENDNMLSVNLLATAMNIAIKNSWVSTTAYVINLMDKVGRVEESFNL